MSVKVVKIVRTVMVMALVGAVIAACGGGSDEGTDATGSATGAPEKASLKIGILPTPDYVAAQIAIDEGYFKDEGLDVTTEIMASGNSAPSIVGGSYDIAGMNWISFLIATSKKVPLTAVAEGSLGKPGYALFLVKKDAETQSLSDLGSQKIGVVASPGNCDLIAQDVLDEEGSDAKPTFVSLAVPDMPANIQRGNVGAACVPEPLASALVASGDFRSIHDLFTGDVGDQFPVSGFVTSAGFAKKNPNTIAAYQRAIQKAIDLIHKDDSVLRPALLKYTTLTEGQATSMNLPSYTKDATDFSNLERVGDLIVKRGVVDKVTIPSVS